MSEDKEILQLAKEIKNEKAREWRRNNKDKVKVINQRYWLKKAKKLKEELESKGEK